jgi:hypothetical protein
LTPDHFPRDRYYCYLEDQPDFLVPRRLLDQPASMNGQLVVNPYCWFGWHGPLPAPLARRAHSVANFYDSPWMVWVEDVVCGALWPFWLGPDYVEMLDGLAPGQPAVNLPPPVVDVLGQALILVAPDWAEARRHEWLESIDGHRARFDAGYVSLSGLLHPFHLGSLRRYYRYHTRLGTFALGDDQTARRYVGYDEIVTRFFHYQLADIVSDLARRRVMPSYSYLAFYQGGAVLDPHTDREECEYTVTMAIDATPEPDAEVPWPVQFMTPDGPAAAWQHLGDALVFRGRALSHWRDRLDDGYTASSVLWHFVDAGSPS